MSKDLTYSEAVDQHAKLSRQKRTKENALKLSALERKINELRKPVKRALSD